MEALSLEKGHKKPFFYPKGKQSHDRSSPQELEDGPYSFTIKVVIHSSVPKYFWDTMHCISLWGENLSFLKI